jgi:hypothetical protein
MYIGLFAALFPCHSCLVIALHLSSEFNASWRNVLLSWLISLGMLAVFASMVVMAFISGTCYFSGSSQFQELACNSSTPLGLFVIGMIFSLLSLVGWVIALRMFFCLVENKPGPKVFPFFVA